MEEAFPLSGMHHNHIFDRMARPLWNPYAWQWMHFEDLPGNTGDASLASKIPLQNLLVETVTVHSPIDTLTFTGVSITVFGGGDGGEIILSNVNVYLHRTSRENGIPVDLLDTVYHNNVTFKGTVIEDSTPQPSQQ